MFGSPNSVRGLLKPCRGSPSIPRNSSLFAQGVHPLYGKFISLRDPADPSPATCERVALFFVVWLWGCVFAGLLVCWVVGLLGCVVIQNRSQISPKSVPKGSQRGPKWLPKRVPRGSYDLGRTWGAFGNFCARIFGALGPFWEPFWGPVGSRGGPQIELLGTKWAQEAPKCCSGGGSRRRSKIERKHGPKMSDFWEART